MPGSGAAFRPVGKAMNIDRRLLRYLYAFKAPLTLALVCVLAAGIATVAQAGLLSHAIARLFLQQQTLNGVRSVLYFFLAAAILRLASQWAWQSILYRIAARVKQKIRQQITARLLSMGPARIAAEQSGELKATLVAGVEKLDAFFSEYLPQLVVAALVPLLILAFVFPRDRISGLVFLLTAPLIPLFMVLIGDMARIVTRKQWSVLSRLSAFFMELLLGMTTLKVLGCSRDQAKKIRQITDEFRTTTMQVLRVAFLSALVLELLSTLSTAIIAVEIGLRLLYARMTFEQALFILILAPEFYQPLRRLGAHFHAGLEGLAAAKRIFELLDDNAVATAGAREALPGKEGVIAAQNRPDPGAPRLEAGEVLPTPGDLSAAQSGPGSGPQFCGIGAAMPPHGSICFADVGYTYPGATTPALEGLSFCMAPGQKTALVGPSGAGKTTVVSLLLRFIEPQQGALLIGNEPLSRIDPDHWRSRLTWAPQHPFLFHATVADNIRLADPGAAMGQVRLAARQAHLDDFHREPAAGL